MLERDASSAGVQLGGLYNQAEIKILVCYILSTVDQPVPATMLANLLHYEGIANGFEVSDAIVSLENGGHIELFNEKEGTYVITEKGRRIERTLKTSLSFTVKNRATKAALKMLARIRNAKETKFEISKEGERMFLTCSALDGTQPFMSIKLPIVDEVQAEYIKERFIEDPSKIYSTLLNMLTD